MENQEITTEKLEALIAKAKRGVELSEPERQYLREFRNMEAYRTRSGGVDFHATEKMSNPLDEGAFIKTENKRFAEANPYKGRIAVYDPDRAPTPAASVPMTSFPSGVLHAFIG